MKWLIAVEYYVEEACSLSSPNNYTPTPFTPCSLSSLSKITPFTLDLGWNWNYVQRFAL